MLAVTFGVGGKDNCVVVAGGPYVFARTERGSFVLPARCPHRGGPLHLAEFIAGSTQLRCPWHGRATSVTRWLREGIPAVRRGKTVIAVFDVASDAAYTRERRPMSPALTRTRAGPRRLG